MSNQPTLTSQNIATVIIVTVIERNSSINSDSDESITGMCVILVLSVTVCLFSTHAMTGSLLLN